MSYILDALRKADAERRGVPAPQGMTEPAVLVATDGDGDGDGPPERARPWIWLLAGVGLALIVALVWNLWLGVPASPPVAASVPAAAPVAPPAPVPPPPVAPVAAAPVPPQTPPPEPDTLPSFPPALPDAPKAEARPAYPPGTEPRFAAKGPPPPGITEVVPANAARAPAGADRVQQLHELPEAVRRDLPRLTISGAMYSERVSDRMVVINGQVFHEGNAVAREVTLKQIRLKSAVVEFRGHRIELGY